MNTFLLTGKKDDSWTREEIENLHGKVGDSYDQYIIFKQLYKNLTDTKNKIDEHEAQSVDKPSDTFQVVYDKNAIKSQEDWTDWNTVKKLTNPHELIHIPCNGINNSVAYYIPVSRSYFKMVEMIKEFNFFENCENRNLTIACLAEGPGGFIEAIIKHRKNNFDNIFGVTLRGNNRNVPNWRRMQYVLEKLNRNNDLKPNVDLSYGDMYQEEDIRRFTYKVKSVAHLVTADGGFDYTASFNYQEQVSYRLIFSEILSALYIQAIGGHFVCKIFDIFSVLSMKMIYLVYCFYDEVYIYKPYTSRSANSEKYLIAKNFKGINPSWLQKLREIQENWIKNDNSILDIEGLILPNDFITSIFKFNQMFVKSQIDNIEQTLNFINKPPSKIAYQKIIQQQVKNGLDWCEKYQENINYKSKYRIHYNKGGVSQGGVSPPP